MATFKLAINKRYGQFFYTYHPAGEPSKENEKGIATLDELIKSVEKNYNDSVKTDDDSVIYRGIAYESWAMLRATVRDSRF